MSKEYQQVLDSALALPQKEFFALVQALLRSVQEKISTESPDSHMPWETEEFFQELDRRVDDIRTGKTKTVSGEEVMKKLKKRRV